MNTQTYFQKILEDDPFFYDVMIGFANKIKANIDNIKTNPLFDVKSNQYVMPYDNSKETSAKRIYFLRVMTREVKSVEDFATGIHAFIIEQLGDEIFKALIESNKYFYPVVNDDDSITIELIQGFVLKESK